MSVSRSPRGAFRPAPANPLPLFERSDSNSPVTPYHLLARARHRNLSPTRAPLVAADVALWPSWTKLSVEELDLDGFDDKGHPLSLKGGF
jgi:hypothetical protein